MRLPTHTSGRALMRAFLLTLVLTFGFSAGSYVLFDSHHEAQARSGSSAGGGSFGGGSSSGGGGGGGGYSGGGYSGGGYSGGGGYGGGYPMPVPVPYGGGGGYGIGGCAGLGLPMLIFFAFLAFRFMARRRQFMQQRGGSVSPLGPIFGGGGSREKVDVALLELAVRDPERTVQNSIEQLARRSNLDNSEQLRAFLNEILLMLQRNMNVIDHGRLVLTEDKSAAQAEATFRQLVSQARAKFDREILRKDRLGSREAATRNMQTDGLVDEDGDLGVQEYVVLSLAVAWKDGPNLPDTLDSYADLHQRLNELERITSNELMVVEVVWSPSAESDAMSKMDMMTVYPELRPLG